MKKTTQILGMMCMVAILAIGTMSCKKEKTNTVSSFDIILPALDGDPFDDSKAYIDLVNGGAVKWYQRDRVMMYSIDADYTKSLVREFGSDATTGVTQAHFSSTGDPMTKGSEGFFAFYPASKASTRITEGNRAYFTVGGTQDCGEADLFAGTSYAGKIYMDPQGFVGAATCDVIEPYAVFALKAIFGYLNVRVKDGNASAKRLKSVTITDNNLHLTGSMSISIPALKSTDLDAMKLLGVNYKSDGNVGTYTTGLKAKLQDVGYMSEPDGNSVTLDCSKANNGFGAQITSSNKFFFIPLRPGALLGDFTITLKFFGEEDTPFVVNVPANKKYIMIPGYNTNITIDIAQPNGGIQ